MAKRNFWTRLDGILGGALVGLIFGSWIVFSADQQSSINALSAYIIGGLCIVTTLVGAIWPKTFSWIVSIRPN